MSVRRFLPRLEKKFAGLTVETIAEDGSFSGYASLFGEVDLGKDTIEAGAFEKSVSERGAAGIRMLWQHDPNQPIGVWTLVREDERGLYVEGRLAKGVAKAAEVLELMRSGAIDGLSIGFRTVKARTGTGGIRQPRRLSGHSALSRGNGGNAPSLILSLSEDLAAIMVRQAHHDGSTGSP